MTIAVSDNAALAIAAAIREQTDVHRQIQTSVASLVTQVTAMNTFLANNFSVAAANTPLTPAASMRTAASSSKDMASYFSHVTKNQSELGGKIDKVVTGLAAVSGQLAAGVTTYQIATVDQIRNNKFQQNTTNAALERSGLPPTAVTVPNMQAQVQQTVTDVSDLKLQVASANLVTGAITDSFAFAGTQLTAWAAETYLGQAAITGWGQLKQLLTIVKPAQTAAAGVSATNTATTSVLSGTPSIPGDVA
jgi:hypothetical protein